MCLLAFKPKNTASLPSVHALATAFRSNPDWVGIGIADGRTVTVHKFRTFEDFLIFHESAPYIRAPENFSIIWHFRLATSGGVNPRLAHPFFLSSDYDVATGPASRALPIVAHNGAFSYAFPPERGESDTLHLVRQYLASKAIKSRIRSPRILRLLELAIGSSNKIVILHPDHHHDIINKAYFHQEEGIWYSNRSYTTENALHSYNFSWTALKEGIEAIK